MIVSRARLVLPMKSVSFSAPTNTYEYKKNGKHRWLQKLLFDVLDWLGCRVDEIAYKQVVIETDDFMVKLREHYEEVSRQIPLYGEEARLIIGADDFNELMNTPGVDRLIGFKANYDVGHRGRNGETHYSVMGLNVTIVPWMKGMVILP